jgi:hypothetical protein
MSDGVVAELAETIASLRAELSTAMAEGQDSQLHFALGPVEVEFQVAVTRDAGVDGGVRFGVVSFGGKGNLSNAATHRISMTLQPVVNGQPAEVHQYLVRPPT